MVWQIFQLDLLSKWKNGSECWTFLGWCTNCRTYVGGIKCVLILYFKIIIWSLQISSAVIFCLCSMSSQQTASILATRKRDTVKGMWTKACLIPPDYSGRFQRRYSRALHHLLPLTYLHWMNILVTVYFHHKMNQDISLLPPVLVPRCHWDFIPISQADSWWRGLPRLSVYWVWERTDQEVQDQPWCLYSAGPAAGTVPSKAAVIHRPISGMALLTLLLTVAFWVLNCIIHHH